MTTLPTHLSKAPVGRETLRREVIEAHQRDRIVEVAIEVFAERGYRRTTIDNIIAAAQIGVGSFYSLFEGKEDCFLAAYERITADTRQQIEEAVPSVASWPEAAVIALRTLLELLAADPDRARIALVMVQTAGPRPRDCYEKTLEELLPVVARGREFSPWAEELPASLEFAILSGLNWFLQQRIDSGQVEGLPDALPEVLEIFLAPYLGDDEVERLAAQVA